MDEPTRIVVARTPTELELINSAIHDGWFSLNDLEFDPARGELRALFTHDESVVRSLSSLKGRRAGLVVIRRVTSWELDDRQRVLWYDFNRLTYHPSRGRLQVLTNIPLLLRADLAALEVHVHKCGESGRAELCVPL